MSGSLTSDNGDPSEGDLGWVDADSSAKASQEAVRYMIRAAAERLRTAKSAVEMPDADRLADLLQRAVAWRLVTDPGFGEFARSAVDAIIRYGVSSSYRRTVELATAIARVAEALEEAGEPSSDLHLKRAVYLRTATVGGSLRVGAIEAALRTAQSPDEQFAAHLEWAQLHVDTSRYPTAWHVLTKCEEFAVLSRSPDVASVEIQQMRGLVYYYRGAARRARRIFETVCRSLDELPPAPRLDRIAAEAHHYLGRMAALRGDYETAARLLVTANGLSAGSGRQQRRSVAWFHLRLAELLMDAGSEAEMQYHLQEAEAAIRLAQEISSAELQFDTLQARINLKAGDPERAKRILKRSIMASTEQRHVRGLLLSTWGLLRVYVTTRQYRKAIDAVRSVVRAWRTTEARSDPGRHASQGNGGRLRQLLTSLSAMVRSGRMAMRTASQSYRRRIRRRPELSCPCGADHYVSSRRLRSDESDTGQR